MRVDCHAIKLMGLRARETVTHVWWCGFTAFRLTQYHHHYVCVRVCVYLIAFVGSMANYLLFEERISSVRTEREVEPCEIE